MGFGWRFFCGYLGFLFLFRLSILFLIALVVDEGFVVAKYIFGNF